MKKSFITLNRWECYMTVFFLLLVVVTIIGSVVNNSWDATDTLSTIFVATVFILLYIWRQNTIKWESGRTVYIIVTHPTDEFTVDEEYFFQAKMPYYTEFYQDYNSADEDRDELWDYYESWFFIKEVKWIPGTCWV